MKHPISAAVALAIGLGLIAGGQAQANTRHHSAAHKSMMSRTAASQTQASQSGAPATRNDIKQAQQQLRSDGLYKGPVNGVLGQSTRVAIGHFQKKNGLPHTARLDSATRDRLMGSQGVGVGSSMPSGTSTTTPGADTGTSSTPTIPPATTTPGAGASDSTSGPTTPGTSTTTSH